MNTHNIKEGDLIIDTEKIGLFINGAYQGVPVRCKKILDDEYLIWESLDGKESACDGIDQFRKTDEVS